jgi:predicted phage terminase large subunit-like protein
LSTEALKKLALASKKLAILEERERQSQRGGGLMAFVRYFWEILEPNQKFVDGWAIQAMAEHLEAVHFGEINRLLINVPPGFSKSLMCNVFFPAWEWSAMGRPDLRYLSFSYAAHLTRRDNRKLVNLIRSPLYAELWGKHIDMQLVKEGEELIANNHTGWKFASSVGGVGTGERGNRILCLPYNTKISTSNGLLDIGDIVTQKLPVQIAGLGIDGKLCWQNIEAYEQNPGSDLIELSWNGGSLHCTPEHPVFIQGRGYVAASEVRRGDSVLWTREPFSLPHMREGNPAQTEPTSEVLQQRVPLRSSEAAGFRSKQQAVHRVRQDGLSAARALGAHQSPLLQSRMPWQVEYRREQPRLGRRHDTKDLRVLREDVYLQAGTGKTAYDHFLFPVLRKQKYVGRQQSSTTKINTEILRVVQDAVYSVERWLEILFDAMQKHRSLASYERKGQRPVYTWGSGTSLSTGMDKDSQGQNQSKRWKSLPTVWKRARAGQASSRASHRLHKGESRPRQLDNVVQILSRKDARPEISTSQVETRTIRSVKRVGRVDTVFNLRVTPCHNYFANGILTHNCDDPHNIRDSESDIVRTGIVRWFRESMQNRLNNMSDAIIVIMQRVHEDDVSGNIIADEKGLGYTRLRIPMEYIEDDPWAQPTKIGWTDPRRIAGELAWPERYTAEDLHPFKTIAYMWASQYMQDPEPRGGAIILRDWWRVWEDPATKQCTLCGSYEIEKVPSKDPKSRWCLCLACNKHFLSRPARFPGCSYVLASLDTSYTEKERNDPSAMTVWGLFNHPKTNEPGIILMDAWRKWLRMNSEPTQKFSDESELDYKERTRPSWGLVEWTVDTCRRFKVNSLLIENRASGKTLQQELQLQYGRELWTTVMKVPEGDKESRAHSVVGIFAQGMVWAPDKDYASLMIEESAKFPYGKYRDLTDSMTQALRHFRNTGMLEFEQERLADLAEETRQPYQRMQPLYPV